MTDFHFHLVSDATGETIISVAHAAVAQFEDVEANEHIWSLVRSSRQMDRVLAAIQANPGVVIYTLVDPARRDQLTIGCQKIGVPCVPVLDPVLGVLSTYLGRAVKGQPGGQHALDAEYFARVDAIQFVLRHDDGQSPYDLEEADIIVVGVSRTSKTPTCFYLANRGLKAANVPIVPGVDPPEELLKASKPLVIALYQSPDRLVQIRKNRMTMLKQDGESDYIEPDAVKRELAYARRLYEKHGWTVLDVTRRSIEETAAAILQLYQERFGALP
ncbi:MAG: kinase/pyrophosphorylase [Alphaproteobacteria bacterium]|jgi:[pyruvate, water dikinase]-phosphate phosphotransferase / [pyruvate, water dikinase] kinase|nr:kinase/pyrophosphorylase [Rhodospirillaceae bacterium]MBT6509044.1 kinase/pyrophosphorylase [Rhodospirillaceae bacterium]MBT7613621.1 kinase/pyrophosphorylase [Rhodospirillaceae bacterium]MBT7649071.1 kinase/pyrophosphorylase [Rhodospirillaceae bacterium]MDG2479863.1 kinase/pyrophosphorylase [Alphaproteobacteria bacterium]